MPLDPNRQLEKEKKLIERIEKYSKRFSDSFVNLEQVIKAIDNKDFLRKIAFLQAQEDLKKVADSIIAQEVQRSILACPEFNYSIYLQRMKTALAANKGYGNLYAIYPDFSRERVAAGVGFEALGEIEDWAKAVKLYRQVLNESKTINVKQATIELRSHFWKEKYYRVDREGKKIPKTITDRKTKETKEIDITDRYRGKYRETIIARLSYIPENQAPFWYLIEHGNAKGTMPNDEQGTPYPKNGPHPFVARIERKLVNTFADIYNDYYEKIEKEWNKRIVDDFGFRVEKTAEESWQDYTRKLKDTIKLVEQKPEIKDSQAVKEAILKEASTTEIAFDNFMRRGVEEIGARVPKGMKGGHRPGTFVKVK